MLDANALVRSVAPLLKQKRTAGWTHEEQMELLMKRWLANAQHEPMLGMSKRTANSVPAAATALWLCAASSGRRGDLTFV